MAGIFLILLFLPGRSTLLAAEQQPKTLRVAFTELDGLMEKDADGTRHGLIVDYLNEISKYTGWHYQYIDTTGETVLDEFAAGDYDLMGGNYYIPGLEKYYAYPDYNIGSNKSVLLARPGDTRIRSYDIRSLNGKTIGVYDRAVENVRRLKEFLSMNNLDCTLRYYKYEELSDDGNLYPHLENGEVDLLLGNMSDRDGPFQAVFSFDSQPYYIVTNVGNQEILDGLNMAMEKILDSNPNFASERYTANFTDELIIDIYLNEEELSYIQHKKTVSVAVPKTYHPFSCLNSDDMHNGITFDILQEVSEFTGLEFSYVYTDSYVEALRQVQQGNADLLGFYLGSEEDSIELGLALTAPFTTINSIVVRNKAVSYPDSGLAAAVLEGRKLPSDIHAEELKSYSHTSDALAAVNRGDADFVYGEASYLEHEIQRNHFTNVVPVTLVTDRNEISFALSRPADSSLLSIINKAVNRMSSERKAELLDQNMVSLGTNQFSIKEFIYANPVLFIVILSLFLLVLVTAVLWINRTRVKAAVMHNNLEKAEAESRAKGEFLSRMSHELRTPMNAVIGLADLTVMAEGLPDSVRENLDKLRESSHYLLDLINDILDMSRIDGGMLTIASEPFSLEQMIIELQSMMEVDAGRRALTYKVEQDITHSGVTGDAIRLRQVLTNLLSNAFKFTPPGGTVLLRIKETENSKDNATYLFQVIDTGAGIRPSDQERIFDSFEQVGTNYSKSQGTGLGLPISSNIVQLMGGRLSVRSEPGRGSEFYFTLTLPYGEPVSDGQDILTEDGFLNQVRILLAEDNDLNAEIAVQLLECQGADVTRCENGRLAVEAFAQSRPGDYQLIIMDIQMPELNGLDAARAIRAMERPDAAAIPIVAMTANAFKEDADAAMEAGMNGFASKPLDVKYLYRLLDQLLKDHQSE
ncbi:ATP-binding protein [Anaerolentibacter hominis]|uniref:ATP-binding protein n=1 Tax=Anaerolentibacter hominis TaxID=3079009 RepID=UPI0031B83D9F